MTVDSDLDLLLVRPDGTPGEQWAAQVDYLVEDVTRWIGNDTRPRNSARGELTVDQATRSESELLTAVATSGKLRNSLGRYPQQGADVADRHPLRTQLLDGLA